MIISTSYYPTELLPYHHYKHQEEASQKQLTDLTYTKLKSCKSDLDLFELALDEWN